MNSGSFRGMFCHFLRLIWVFRPVFVSELNRRCVRMKANRSLSSSSLCVCVACWGLKGFCAHICCRAFSETPNRPLEPQSGPLNSPREKERSERDPPRLTTHASNEQKILRAWNRNEMCAYNPSTVYSNPTGWESQRWAREREREREGATPSKAPPQQTTTTTTLPAAQRSEQTSAEDRGAARRELLLNYWSSFWE